MHYCTSGCGYDHFRCPHEKTERLQVRRKMIITPVAGVVAKLIDSF
jgi:hypothetical protein